MSEPAQDLMFEIKTEATKLNDWCFNMTLNSNLTKFDTV